MGISSIWGVGERQEEGREDGVKESWGMICYTGPRKTIKWGWEEAEH